MESEKFLKKIDDWEVLTEGGFKPFSGISKTKDVEFLCKLTFSDGTYLICTPGHPIKYPNGEFLEAIDVQLGDVVSGKEIVSIKIENGNFEVYDFINVADGEEYIANDINVHNCAFIDSIEEIWVSAQSTLSTGGQAILLSTPNGIGNFFHRMWLEAAEKKTFNQIRLKWTDHPDRDQKWRDAQEDILGKLGAAQECDADFNSSGNTVIDPEILKLYRTKTKSPVERRMSDQGLWIWEYPNYSRQYMVCADVSRGDGSDFSACHVIEIESLKQVAEFKSKIPTRDYGNFLVSLATEYNNALLVVENMNIGWDVVQTIIDRKYDNMFYSSTDLKYVDVESQMTNRINAQDKKMTPGFTTTSANRQLMIAKIELFIRENLVEINSERLIEELNTFIWNGHKSEAMRGYNDDLIMAYAIGLWVRDTALRLQTQSIAINRAALDGIGNSYSKGIVSSNGANSSFYRTTGTPLKNPWSMQVLGGNEDLKWLLR